MRAHIDYFQRQIADYFNEMLTAVAFTQFTGLLAGKSLASVTITLSKGVQREPVLISELLPYANSVTNGIAELYVVRVIAAWNDLLLNIFKSVITENISTDKPLPELCWRNKEKVDFPSMKPLSQETCEKAGTDFSFLTYSIRIAYINKLLIASPTVDKQLMIVRKHVEVRNSFQHHNGMVYGGFLKNLSMKYVELLDKDGCAKKFTEHSKLELSAAELDKLHKALFQITSNWKKSNANIPA